MLDEKRLELGHVVGLLLAKPYGTCRSFADAQKETRGFVAWKSAGKTLPRLAPFHFPYIFDPCRAQHLRPAASWETLTTTASEDYNLPIRASRSDPKSCLTEKTVPNSDFLSLDTVT